MRTNQQHADNIRDALSRLMKAKDADEVNGFMADIFSTIAAKISELESQQERIVTVAELRVGDTFEYEDVWKITRIQDYNAGTNIYTEGSEYPDVPTLTLRKAQAVTLIEREEDQVK